jgi:Uma2 family endonuclease
MERDAMTISTPIDNPPLTLRLRPAISLSDEEFFALCRQNPDLRIERSAEGEVEIMAPASGGSSIRNATVAYFLKAWALQDGTGTVFDSSGGFVLPNGATRSPDAAWIRESRLARLTAVEIERFIPLCPDFVIEIRSPSNSLALTQEKLREYIANGAHLGWLLDVPSRRAYVYRPDHPVAEFDGPVALSGDPELPGFILDLTKVWELGFGSRS